MKATHKAVLSSIAAVGVVFMISTGASAQWGGPWQQGPWGPGVNNPRNQGQAQTQDRRIAMTRHGQNMEELEKLFDGRLNFDRGRALRLAKSIVAEGGENLWGKFESGSHGRNSRVMPRILSDFDTFKAYAEALKSNAETLVASLEAQPTPHDVMRGGAYVPRGSNPRPPWARGPNDRRQRDFGAVDMRALQSFAAVSATCDVCHMVYRGWR